MNESCQKCQKPPALCVCSLIKKFETTTRLLVLQHPQEPDHELGSAWLAVECLSQGQLKVGLSWPNLAK
ncbi:MAG: DTW domain-containing protein, partial [Bdellovibrionales bacterium]|nr:DTW domain-containing protein [Bdellovibrionales bacterium]